MSYEELTGAFTFGVVNLLCNKFWTTYQRPDGSGRQVLVYRGQVGIAGDNDPVYERFFAGGFTTIRGFQWRGVGPNVNGFFTGGDFMLLNSLEYQVPVVAKDNIFLVGFVDSGTVSPRINDFQNYAVSVGFGIRFTVPMLGPVPIALDFGFPVVKPPGDLQQIFNFWMGFTAANGLADSFLSGGRQPPESYRPRGADAPRSESLQMSSLTLKPKTKSRTGSAAGAIEDQCCPGLT